MHLFRVLRALEGERDLRDQRVDAFPRLLRQPLAGVEDERAVVTGDGDRDLGMHAGLRACPAGFGDGDTAERQSDRCLVVADDLVRGVGRDAMDVLARPGRDERGRGAAQDTLAALGALVSRNEPGEPHDHESGQGNSRAHDDEELARSGPDRGHREHRRRRERGGRQHGEPLPGEALLRIRVRLGELDHGGMQRGGPPENGRDDEEQVDRVAHLVPAVQGPEAVERVAGELEQKRDRDHRECRRPETWAEHHPRGERHEEHVHHRERERDCRLERARVARQARLNEERPADRRNADRDDSRVDETRPVATRRLPANHEQEGDGQNGVGGKREVVPRGRERHVADLLQLDRIQGVGGHRAEPADGDEIPGRLGSRPVQADADERRRDRSDREQLVPAVVVRRVTRQRHVRQRARDGNEEERAIWARDAHQVPIGTPPPDVKSW